jgi:hypothetical protein
VVGGDVAEVGRSDGLGGDGDDVTLGDSDPKNKLLISLKFNPFPVLV